MLQELLGDLYLNHLKHREKAEPFLMASLEHKLNKIIPVDKMIKMMNESDENNKAGEFIQKALENNPELYNQMKKTLSSLFINNHLDKVMKDVAEDADLANSEFKLKEYAEDLLKVNQEIIQHGSVDATTHNKLEEFNKRFMASNNFNVNGFKQETELLKEKVEIALDNESNCQ